MKILLLYADYSNTSSYYDDWYDAFTNEADFDCHSIDICNIDLNKLKKNINNYEFIVMLHSTNADNLSHIKKLTTILEERVGKLAIFSGNEVNIPGVSMPDKLALFKELSPEFIFTQLLEETGKWLYNGCSKAHIFSIPHALNSNVFYHIDNKSRKLDLGVRSFQYNTHLGDNERTVFFKKIDEQAILMGLNNDISFDPTKRFNRNEWAKFLRECKGTIATEAGTYYLEHNDQLVSTIQNFLYETRKKTSALTINNDSFLADAYQAMPKQIKETIKFLYYKYAEKFNIKHEHMLSDDIPFDIIYEQIIKNYPMCPYYSKAISSRQFDAIGTKTCLIMLEGRYNDLLTPKTHYLEVRKDFSNLEEILEQFKDETMRKNITDSAWEYCMQNHQHKHRINKIKTIFSGK